MRNSMLLSFLFLLFLGLTSCGDRDAVWVEREAADCCNPWDIIPADDPFEAGVILARAAQFLEMNDIDIIDAEVEDTGRQVICVTCCGCPTGVIVQLKIPIQQLGRAEELGFFEL